MAKQKRLDVDGQKMNEIDMGLYEFYINFEDEECWTEEDEENWINWQNCLEEIEIADIADELLINFYN